MDVLGASYIVNKTLTIQVLTSVMEAVQQGNLIYIYMESPIYINNTLDGPCGCSQIISATSLSTLLGSSPECQHLDEMVKIYLKKDSSIVDQLTLQHTYIKPPLLVTGLHPVPQLLLSLPNSPDNNHHFKTQLVIVKSQITYVDSLKYELNWTQIGDSPSKIFFDNKQEILTIREGQLKAGNYSVGLLVLFTDSPNDYELYEEINFTMASIPSVQILGGNLEMHYMSNLNLEAICTDNDQNNNGDTLTWEWEISEKEDFSNTAALKDGSPIAVSEYSNKSNISFLGGVLDYKSYYFRVTVTKWEYYTSTYKTWVKVFEQGPNLQLKVDNIKLKQNNREDFCISASSWSFYGSDVDIIWKRILPSIVGTKIEGIRICLPASALQPGGEYEITCQARDTRPDTERALETVEVREMSVNILIAKAPHVGSVISDPQVGYGFIDIFTFNALGWFDADTAGGILLYSFQVQVATSSQTNFVSLNSFSSIPSLSTTLPPGDPIYRHLVIIRANAKNQYGVLVYKDIHLKVLPPPQIDDKLDFIDNQLFKDFESKPLSEQLFILSMATYFSSVDDDAAVNATDSATQDACGGCSGQGSCVADACQCNEGFDGEFCQTTQQNVDEFIQANDKIMSKMETIVDNVDTQTLFEGEDGNILLSAIGGVTKTQSVNNSATNTKATIILKNITAFFESEHETGSKQKASGAADKGIKLSESTGRMIVGVVDNLVQGLEYESRTGRKQIPNSNSYTEPENIFRKSIEMKGILETTGALMLAGLNEGEEISVETDSFLVKGGKSEGKDMNSRLLKSPLNTLHFPSKGLGLEGKSASFQLVTWKFNPFTGQQQGNTLISNALTLNLYQDNDIRPKEINNLTEPMKIYFKIRKYAPAHYCTYFNYDTNNFSDKGTSLYYSRMNDDGNGMVICSSTHLSDYGVLQNAPAEYMAVMSKVDYATITKFSKYEDYDYMASPIFWFVLIISAIFCVIYIFGVYEDMKAYRKEKQVHAAEIKENKERELNSMGIGSEFTLDGSAKKTKLDPLEESKQLEENTTPVLVLEGSEKGSGQNTGRFEIGSKKEGEDVGIINIINIPSLPTHQASKWEDGEDIENEAHTPVSKILLMLEEKDSLPNIHEEITDLKSGNIEEEVHIKNVQLSCDDFSEEGYNVPESEGWISLSIQENAISCQEESKSIINPNDLQVPEFPVFPDDAQSLDKMSNNQFPLEFLLDGEIKYRKGQLNISQTMITEEKKELQIQDSPDNNENTKKENDHKEECVSMRVLPCRKTMAAAHRPKKTTCKSFCIEFAAILCVLHPYVNIFFILNDQTLNIRVLLLYIEVLFDLMLCGAFTDSEGEEVGEEVNIVTMIMIGMTCVVLTLLFVLIVAAFFGEGGPPDGVLDEDGKVLNQEKYQKFLKKEKIKHIIGYIVAVIIICFCMAYINLQSAVFGTTVSYIWFFTWLIGFLFDILIIQPVKCLIYYICTRQYLVKIILDIVSGGLSIPPSVE